MMDIDDIFRLKADLSAGADNLKAAMQIRTQHQVRIEK